MRGTIVPLVLALAWLPALSATAAPRIDLEMATERGLPITAHQKWARDLQALEVGSVRLREARPGEQPAVESIGSERAPAFAVTALLTARGQIIVAGGKRFSRETLPQFKKWLHNLDVDNPNDPQPERGAFGLTAEELVATHEKLAGKIDFATKGQPIADVVRRLKRDLPLSLEIGADALEALESGEVVHDELQGLSCGTALAAALRPAGLVFAPTLRGKEVVLKIASSRSLDESWPIGWPSERGLTATVPNLGKFINVEINDVVLADALNSIQKRIETPFLYDHNGLARQRIDPAKTRCSLAKGKTYYKAILDRILAQAHLKCEVRVDEADTPLLWISPVK